MQNPVLRRPVLSQSTFCLPEQFQSSRAFIFRRACQVTREQEQPGTKAIRPALIRRGWQESRRARQPSRSSEDADRFG